MQRAKRGSYLQAANANCMRLDLVFFKESGTCSGLEILEQYRYVLLARLLKQGILMITSITNVAELSEISGGRSSSTTTTTSRDFWIFWRLEQIL